MSDYNHPPPPPLPTASLPLPPALSTACPPAEDPADQQPITSFAEAVESLLRQPRRLMHQLHQPGRGHIIAALLGLAVICALVYGVVVGTFSGDTQLWAAPVKTAAGLFFTAAICLPSLYIFACLGGSQARLIEVVGLLAGLLALMTVLLVGFAPVAWVFSQSTKSVGAMGALHLMFFLVATCFGLRFLLAGFSQLNTTSAGLSVWTLIFILVLLQMTTALRPFIGTADTFFPPEKKFFIAHWAECLRK
jgi:hypothetical protein